MPLVEITDEQVIELVKTLPESKQHRILKFLLTQPWQSWQKLTGDSTEKARLAAKKRGENWDSMTEEEKELFIDELVHED